MIGWLILAVYVIGWLISTRTFTLAQLNSMSPPVTDDDRGTSFVMGMIVALIWPIAMPVWAIYRIARTSNLLQTDHEKRVEREKLDRAERAELERLRRQAGEFGLPFPEGGQNDHS